MEIQELVARARILFRGAPKRAKVFELVNGRRSAKEIARLSGRGLAATLADLQKLRDMELLSHRKDGNGKTLKNNDSFVYEKVRLLKHLSSTYFAEPTRLPKSVSNRPILKATRMGSIKTPTEQEILDICKAGEDQLYEFKTSGTDADKISKEICAFANTKMGGLIFYGVEDDGTIGNADIKKQIFDQKIQNSIRNTINPALSIKLVERDALGHKIFLILIPPWNKTDVYHYRGRVYLRHGTNVFEAKPEESKKLHKGISVI